MRQREAEMALVNEIGRAVVSQLEFSAIIELVGERLRELFQARSMYIATIEPGSRLIEFPYEVEEGERVTSPAMQLGEGLTSIVIQTKRPLRIATQERAVELGAVNAGLSSNSWLGVPIPVGDVVVGVLCVEDMAVDAYTDADEQLLGTLAANMGVALENARLFDETKRLLTETDERAAELAVINEIGDALSQASSTSRASSMSSAAGSRRCSEPTRCSSPCTTSETETIHFPFDLVDGQRQDGETLALGEGLTSVVIRDRRPLRLASLAEANALGRVVRGLEAESWLGVPILAGERVLGVLALEALEPDIYTRSDERLLSTVASSMGVALENARLFDETKRLLAESDRASGGARAHQRRPARARRTARHAGDVRPRGRADPLDLRRPGRRHRGPRPSRRTAPLPVHRSRTACASRTTRRRRPATTARSSWRAASRCSSINDIAGVGRVDGLALAHPGRARCPQSALFVPLVAAGQSIGVISLQNLDREPPSATATSACSTTLAVEPERRPRERPPLRRDASAC